ncbi:MAG TPA: T9SS type A sorting domain-containing protein [Bacteroidales bacterium]|nr:T9SS type A sorting domain-containing protein [Bacteroidales bacterium]HPT10534.1 T9SS type A sorting domain-containing protein [Bacteroidales bacterium]
MKKFTLLLVVFCISMIAIAQEKYSSVVRKAIPAKTVKEELLPTQPLNFTTNSKSVLEDVIIGETRYDMQTNGAIQNRIYIHPDGTMGGTWTRGTITSSQRGTGYNYYDGTSWGDPPTARVETRRAGWPSYCPYGANGEIIVAHDDALGLLLNKRTNKGTGTWTQSVLAGPAGHVDISWPRMITNGPNHNYIHILATTYSGYMGLDDSYALLYYRSLDGGATWDKKDFIIPDLDSTHYSGFSGDEYAWGTPFGDTIYFAVSGPWVDSFIMKSIDNGDTWTKIPVLSNANKKLSPSVQNVLPFKSSDGAVAVEMDHNGVFHMAFGIGGGYMSGGTKYIYINQNGLVYWNSTMPMVTDSLDLDTLDAHGQLLGYVSDGPGPGDTIIAAPSYRVGLSSFPQLTIDPYNNVYAAWSAVTPGNPSPDPFNYRHIWSRIKFHDHADWTDMKDLNSGILYMYQEFVYPSMAKSLLNGKLQTLVQTSEQPGSNLVDTDIPAHDCNIISFEIDPAGLFPTGTPENTNLVTTVARNFPNPAHGTTNIRLSLTHATSVNLTVTNITGARVMENSLGNLQAGTHDIKLDVSNLTPGIYFYTLTMDTEKVTRKMVIR